MWYTLLVDFMDTKQTDHTDPIKVEHKKINTKLY